MHNGRDNIAHDTIDDIGKDPGVIIESNLTFRDHSSDGRHYGDRDF